ncbi:MAG TPA: peptidylprolyl isomerase [Paludibacter sp.]|nr:peptidylprolyl isomerase [Paludibacter sp.]
MKLFPLQLVLVFALIVNPSCKSKPEAEKPASKPLLEVEGKFLYADDVKQIIPPNVNKKDSAEIAQSFIRKWVIDVLMYENAKRNVSNQAEINEMVESYRKSLTIHQYQQRMIEQRLPKEPSEEELKSFYDQYRDQLVLKENIIRGFLLVLPKKAPNMGNVRSWVQSGNTKALENIEKYSLQNAISYDYFGDKWMPFTEVLKKIPLQIEDPASFISSRRFVETADSLQTYFLRIQDGKTTGQVEPYEMARDRISNILQNKHKADFIAEFESELYKDAIESDAVTFFKQ